MYNDPVKGRPERVKVSQHVAGRLLDRDLVLIKGRSVSWFRDKIYEESMIAKLKTRIESQVGCAVKVRPERNKRGKLKTLTVERVHSTTSTPV